MTTTVSEIRIANIVDAGLNAMLSQNIATTIASEQIENALQESPSADDWAYFGSRVLWSEGFCAITYKNEMGSKSDFDVLAFDNVEAFKRSTNGLKLPDGMTNISVSSVLPNGLNLVGKNERPFRPGRPAVTGINTVMSMLSNSWDRVFGVAAGIVVDDSHKTMSPELRKNLALRRSSLEEKFTRALVFGDTDDPNYREMISSARDILRATY